ncbi:MAG: LPXTG cell wall anchor domain-containing protein [Enterococcus sp.]|nr:LPXTG cell wall anchor domain-containing protein [Enterococcus sp.]
MNERSVNPHLVQKERNKESTSSYRMLPKTGEALSDRLLVLGGMFSLLGALLLVIKRKS